MTILAQVQETEVTLIDQLNASPLAGWLGTFAGWVWGWPLIILLLGTHLFLTFRLGFIQRLVPRGIKLSFSKKDKDSEGDVSHFAALTTALAATIGVGNIFGVAAAVMVGGPGAILWMWLTGVFGIATKYGEAVIGVKYRIVNARGEMSGGPMYALEKGLNMKWLAVIFAMFAALASFGIGNMFQVNAITEMMLEKVNPQFITEASPEGRPMDIRYWTGGILTVATALVVLGGIKSIAAACRFLVPFMAVLYIIGCLVLLGMNFEAVPGALQVIFQSAFSPEAAFGGGIGLALQQVIRQGVARGLFSNEAGLGSAPIVAAAAKTKDPVRQALVSATGTFWDTVVICALTGLVIVTSGEWEAAIVGGEWNKEAMSRAELCAAAFSGLAIYGDLLLTVGLLTFVFSTIIGWAYFGEKAVEYLFGIKVIFIYRILWVVAVFLGALFPIGMIYDFSDAMNGLMAAPNLVALLLLSGVIARETKRYLAENKTD